MNLLFFCGILDNKQLEMLHQKKIRCTKNVNTHKDSSQISEFYYFLLWLKFFFVAVSWIKYSKCMFCDI